MTIVENYVSDRGRQRQRTVIVDLDEARPDQAARSVWQHIRSELKRTVGDSVFAVWLSPLELSATDDRGFLVVGAPDDATRGWLSDRYGPLRHRTGQTAGRDTRLATVRELQLLRALGAPELRLNRPLPHDQQEAV